MRSLIIQHVKCEGPGLLEETLLGRGWSIDLRCMDDPGAALPPDLEGYDSLVVLGGPMGAYEEEVYPYLYKVQNLIREAAAVSKPTLGICLGAQLVARALGAHVGPNRVKEIGWYPLELTPDGQESPLFAGLGAVFPVFQWHGDTFDLPVGARLLARGESCVNQAFVYADCLWALQFHLEVTPSMVSEWSGLYREELVEFGGPGAADRMVDETARRWEEMLPVRERFLHNIECILRGAR